MTEEEQKQLVEKQLAKRVRVAGVLFFVLFVVCLVIPKNKEPQQAPPSAPTENTTPQPALKNNQPKNNQWKEVRSGNLLREGVKLYFTSNKEYWGTVVEAGEKYNRYSGEVEPAVLIYFPELLEEAEERERAERIKKYCRGEKVNMSGLEFLDALDAKTLKGLCSEVDKTYQKGGNKVWHFVSNLIYEGYFCVKSNDPVKY